MAKRILLLQLLLLSSFSMAQPGELIPIFQQTYSAYPAVPRGVLEAVSYTQTRMTYLDASIQESCTGLPRARGYMGMIPDGEQYFNDNLQLVAALSGLPAESLLNDPYQEIMGYAAAYTAIAIEKLEQSGQPANSAPVIRDVLLELTFIPDSGIVNDFARNSELYEIFTFLNNPVFQQRFGFPAYHFNLSQLFGSANYAVLSASRVGFGENGITTETGFSYTPSSTVKSTEYGPAIFNPAATCNISSRNGTAISAITIHTIQGTYAGAISWAQNCNSSVSYHYVVRSSDGQITQMVLEADKAWHVGSENPYTIGYEHEGYVTQSQWYTEALYTASAALSRDIVNSGYGIPALRTYYGASSAGTQTLGNCTKIKGHQHFAGQSHTDPGIYWNWEKYYRLINNAPAITNITAASGNLYDSGGAAGNYADDERRIWIIEPAGASSVSMTFSQFSVESGYDRLFIYDGNSIDANLIGVYTGTTSPGTINASGPALTLEFRSDCATPGTGWAAAYTSTALDAIPPSTIVGALNDYQTEDFTVHFNDSDIGAGVARQYALISDRTNAAADWHGNANFGYLDESFGLEATSWTEQTGNWVLNNQAYELNDATQTNSNTSVFLVQDSLSEYLYHWTQTITTAGTNQRAGAHFFCDNTALPNRGNSYFIYLREGTNVAQIYEVVADNWTLQAEDTVVIEENTAYDVKVTYDPENGLIRVYVDNAFIVEWTDPAPLKTGNGFSLRSGSCGVRYDNIGVYKSRYNELDVTIGAGAIARYQSDNGADAAKVSSFIIDYTDNWSAMDEAGYRIDWTIPVAVSLTDGVFGPDIDTIFDPVISAGWEFTDDHSGLDHYSYAIGTSAAAQDVLAWTNAGSVESINYVLQNPVIGQLYFVHVRAENGAGMICEAVSDGQRLLEEPSSTAGLNNLSSLEFLMYPQPADGFVTISGNWESAEITLVDGAGRLVRKITVSGQQADVRLENLPEGVYHVIVQTDSGIVSKKLVVLHGS